MALWNEKPTTPAPTGRKEPLTPVPTGTVQPAPPPVERPPVDRTPSETALAAPPRRPAPRSEGGESVIAANLTIEGKIEGSGNVRMAGRFKGDVRIDGNFNIDPGAHLTGQVLAAVVVVGGELQGNIESAKRVDVLEGGVIVGDVKAGSITVAAGSRMRGHVEFGWDDEKKVKLPGTAAGS
jgi:cytoskeletal protein CcmA (bactofilin family)